MPPSLDLSRPSPEANRPLPAERDPCGRRGDGPPRPARRGNPPSGGLPKPRGLTGGGGVCLRPKAPARVKDRRGDHTYSGANLPEVSGVVAEVNSCGSRGAGSVAGSLTGTRTDGAIGRPARLGTRTRTRTPSAAVRGARGVARGSLDPAVLSGLAWGRRAENLLCRAVSRTCRYSAVLAQRHSKSSALTGIRVRIRLRHRLWKALIGRPSRPCLGRAAVSRGVTQGVARRRGGGAPSPRPGPSASRPRPPPGSQA